jgi:pentatricopeptide repeat protein
MIKLAGDSKDINNALRLYEYFELQGYNFYTINYNSILWALSNDKKYAEKTLDIFRKMKMQQVLPDVFTYTCVLQATALLGDINTANECLKEMKLMEIEINEHICSGLIATYAGAAKIPYVKIEHLEEYSKDAWAIFKFMEDNNIKIVPKAIDYLLCLHCRMHKLEEVDGLILPLYEKYGLEFTTFTYENLVRMLFDVRKYDRIIQIYENLNSIKDQKIKFNRTLLNVVIETGLRTNDTDLIVNSLQNFNYIEKNPNNRLLRHMANMENLPDSLFVELKNWIDTDKIGRKFRAFTPPQIRERSRTTNRLSRRRGKRIK